MKQQRGEISTGLVAALAALAFVVLVIGIGAMSYVSAYNYGNQMEQNLKATRENNENIYANYGQKVLEIASVPAMARDDLVKVVTAAIQGRYGADGSKATFQFLKEQNPTLDFKLYAKIQEVIEAGRNDFQNGQTRQIDLKRQYETALGTLWTGTFLHMAGYPKINLDDFKIVTTDRAAKAFQTHREDGPILNRQ
jgi:uncharacterized protein (UPF0333 family)